MNITNEVSRIFDLPTVSEGGFSSGGDQYQAFNDAGVECEVGELLYAMVRVLKPKWVLETGTHRGISTVYMALGMLHNELGTIDTMEFIHEHYLYSSKVFELHPSIGQHINNLEVDATKWMPKADRRYGLVLLDTEPNLRFGELLRFWDFIAGGAFIFIHDLHRHMGQVDNKEKGFGWPWGRIPHPLRQYVQSDQLRPFHFPTPRGLTGFYKVAEGDYKWT